MTTLPPSARQVIASGALAHLVTTNVDGSPQVSIVWAGIDGDDLVMASLDDRQKLRNARRDPRVAVSFETAVTNEHGLREYLVVHGQATVQESGAPELLQQLAHVYLGPDVEFPPPAIRKPGYVLRVAPERIGGIGPWA